MHWTALLAYRRFSATARVIDNVACIGCGYNLRGGLARGNCPECGKSIGDSLFLLARAKNVAAGLKTAGRSYFTMCILLLACLPLGWRLQFAAFIIALGAFFRMIGLAEVRYPGALRRLPVIGERIALLWWLCLLDLFVSTSWFVIQLMVAKSATITPVTARQVINTSTSIWLIVALITAFFAGRLAYAMCDLLGYVWTIIEVKIQHVAIAMAVIAALPFLLTYAAGSQRWVLLTILGLFLLMLIFAFGMTGIVLLHIGNGAEQETDVWEEAVAEEEAAVQAGLPPQPPRFDEPPPIRLEP